MRRSEGRAKPSVFRYTVSRMADASLSGATRAVF